jgi:hypothetical protein
VYFVGCLWMDSHTVIEVVGVFVPFFGTLHCFELDGLYSVMPYKSFEFLIKLRQDVPSDLCFRATTIAAIFFGPSVF